MDRGEDPEPPLLWGPGRDHAGHGSHSRTGGPGRLRASDAAPVRQDAAVGPARGRARQDSAGCKATGRHPSAQRGSESHGNSTGALAQTDGRNTGTGRGAGRRTGWGVAVELPVDPGCQRFGQPSSCGMSNSTLPGLWRRLGMAPASNWTIFPTVRGSSSRSRRAAARRRCPPSEFGACCRPSRKTTPHRSSGPDGRSECPYQPMACLLTTRETDCDP